MIQAPLATVALPTLVLPSYNVTTSPLSPMPVMIGAVALVMPSPCWPLSVAGDSVRPDGVAGIVVSMASVSDPEASEALPVKSVSVLVSVCEPGARVALMIDQAPLTTVAVPTLELPSSSVTTSPLTPLPVMTGLVLLVMESPLVPLSLAGNRVRPEGAAGRVLSMVSASNPDESETLPAMSVSVPVRMCGAAARVPVMIVQAPATTVALPTLVLPS